MKKSVDIDALVGDDTLELTMKGKTYIVKDIPLPLFMKMTSLEEDEGNMMVLYDQLSGLLGIETSEIEDVGYRAVTAALGEIQQWILASAKEGTAKMIAEGEDLVDKPSDP